MKDITGRCPTPNDTLAYSNRISRINGSVLVLAKIEDLQENIPFYILRDNEHFPILEDQKFEINDIVLCPLDDSQLILGRVIEQDVWHEQILWVKTADNAERFYGATDVMKLLPTSDSLFFYLKML